MIIDELISAEAMRSVYVTRWSASEAAKIESVVVEMMTIAHEILGGSNDPVRLEQLRRLEWWANAEYLPQLQDWHNDFQSSFEEFAADEADFQVNTLNDQLKEQHFISSIPAADQVASAALASVLPNTNQTLQDAMSRYAPRQYNLFMSTTRAAFAGGITGQELAEKIYGGKLVTNYRKVMGLGAITRAQAQTLASTATSMISSRAKDAIKRENSDLIIGHKWLSTLDSKTSRTCASLDGREFYYRDNPDAPMPPSHYGCRSSATLLLSGRYTLKDEGGTRPSVGDDGAQEVSSGIDYYSWLKRQPAEFIDDALGAEVGLIFRNAGLTPDEFKKVSVDGLFQPLTIQEMAQKSKKIRDYVNGD